MNDALKVSFPCVSLSFFMATLGIGCPEKAFAAPDGAPSQFQAFVTEQLSYDNNLFRLPSNVSDAAAPVQSSGSRQDKINTLSAGTDDQWVFGRQAIEFDALVDSNRYAHNSYLNNIAGNAKLTLDWRVGPRWSGLAGANFSRSLEGFTDIQFYGKDTVDTGGFFVDSQYAVGAHWALTGGLSEANTTHSVEVRQIDNYDSKSGHVGIQYSHSTTDTIGWEYRYTEARFPQASVFEGAPFDRNFKEDTARFLVQYALTHKMLLSASAGYLKRNYPNADIGNFSGNIWRFRLQWQLTPKTQFVFAGWHELAAALDVQSDYFVSKGASISPTWAPTEKLAFSVTAFWDNHTYIGSGPSFIASLLRHDKISSQRVQVTYKPRRPLTLKLSYGHERRDSTFTQLVYDDELVLAGLTFTF
jgi:Putative beta-barrel porin 2